MKAKIRKYFDAIKYHKDDVVLAMIKDGVHIDTQNSYGRTLLIEASWRNDLDLLERCIELGANLDLQDNQGKTALMVAVRTGCLSYPHDLMQPLIILKLWLAGANADLQDIQGATALMHAAYWGNTNSVKALLALSAKNGINIGIKDNEGRTALEYASWAHWAPEGEVANLIKNAQLKEREYNT